MKNELRSPWLDKLKRTQPIDTVKKDHNTDVIIIGGGIAGVSTAYFALTKTNQKVALIEATRIAHGATGHNAGQIATYFERPFSELVEEFGLEKAAQGQKDILNAWTLLQEMHMQAKVKTPLVQCNGYAGCTREEQVLAHLQNMDFLVKAGINMERVFIAHNAPYLSKIPVEYKHLYHILPHEEILSLLQTKDKSYNATLSSRKGTLNSAVFCEEVVGYLLYNFPKRFKLFEHSPVHTLVLEKNKAIVKSNGRKLTAKKVILCTNGFETVKIVNKESDINGKFHEMINGVVGYMAAYLEYPDKTSTAISYFPDTTKKTTEPYFYITRRYYEHEGQNKNLVCIGGPEMALKKKALYKAHKNYFPTAQKDIDLFLKKTYEYAPEKINYTFQWHGLMGYTKSGVRCIGPEPCNPTLLYNLGCNGVGILPSVYGGRRIARFLNKEKLTPSIFDPQDQRCLLPPKPLKKKKSK